MNSMALGIILVLSATAVSAVSQVLLKLSAKRTYLNACQEYINPFVITAYGMYFATTIMSVLALRYIPLTLSTAFGTSGQIFVPVMSYLFLQEKISRRKAVGMVIIIVGIIIFAL